MSDSGSGTYRHPPSNPRECRDAGGYYACFYPGFVRRLAVVRDGQETVIYEQDPTQPFVLPAGETEPWPSSGLEFSGGPDGRELRLELYDPQHEVERIEIVLRKKGGTTGEGGDDGNGGERIVIDDLPVVCPPICPGETGGP